MINQFRKKTLGNQDLLGAAEASSIKLACKTPQRTDKVLTGPEIVEVPNNNGGGGGGGGGGGDGSGSKEGRVVSTSFVIVTTEAEVI